MKRIAYTLVALFIFATSAQAQNYPIFSFGESEISTFNPAAIMNEGSQVYGRFSYDWYNDTDLYKETPCNFQLGGQGVGNWGGVSAQAYFDEYSYFTRHNFQVNYAYQWKIETDKVHRFSIGGGMSLACDYIDMNYLRYDSAKIQGFSPDLNLGFEYSNDKLRVGIGGVNLIGNSVKYDGASVTRNPRVLLTYFIYRCNIKDVVGITPMIYVGYCEKTLVELSLRFDYKKIIYLSYGFRAMDLRHICVLNFTIPKTPVTLNLSYTAAQFHYAQTVAAGINVKL